MKPAPLLTIFLAAWLSGPAWATPWTGESVESRLAAAAALAEKGRDHEALSVYLEVLKSAPEDGRALEAVRSLTERAASSTAAEPAAPIDGARFDGALDEAALEMLREVAEPELRFGFAKARRLFNEGRLLAAYDGFLMLESRKPPQDWLRDEIRRYLRERIPRELEKRSAGGFYGASGELYSRDVFAAFARRDWEGAHRNLELWLSVSAPARLQGGVELLQETGEMLARLKTRIALMLTQERGGAWLSDARQAFLEQNYDAAAGMLETFIPAAGNAELSARAWKELGAAYDRGQLLDSIGMTEKAMADRQYSRAFMLIADAMARYPDSKRMTELRNELIEKIRTGTDKAGTAAARAAAAETARAETPEPPQAQTGAPETQPAAAEVTAPKPPRPHRQAPKAARTEAPAPARIPTEAERAEAESLYLQGISAYATGDPEKAAAFWKAALALVPDHQKSMKAIERLAAEGGAGR